MEWADSTSRSVTWAGRIPTRFFKKAVGAESSDDEFGILEGHKCLSRTLPPARVGVCLQLPLAAAATNQLHYPNSSSPVRNGSPTGCRDSGSGCARDLVRSGVARFGSGKPFMSRQQIPHAGRSWTGDAFCRQDADTAAWISASKRSTLAPSNDADAVPFQPRFLLQEIVFAHCPYLPQPFLRGNLLSIQEIATYSRCNICEQASSGERSTAPVPAGTGVCQHIVLATGREPARQCSVGVEKRKIDADAVPFQLWFLHQELMFAHCPHQPCTSNRENFLNRSDLLSLSEESQALSATSCRSG